MYNSFTKGSPAYDWMQEALSTQRELESAQDATEATFENIIGEADSLLEELETERDDLQEELDELTKKYEALKKVADAQNEDYHMILALLREMFVIHEKGLIYTRNRLKALGELNEAQDPAGGSGAGGDGGGEGPDQQSPGSTTSEGITRPQIP